MSDGQPMAVVVDDDVMIRMHASEILEDSGFAVLEAGDGDEAIGVLERAPPTVELLFTDVQMPGSRDGFALAREVAARWPKIAIVVASGQATPGPGDLPEGARFIGKPFSAEMVRDHVREILPDGRKPGPLKG